MNSWEVSIQKTIQVFQCQSVDFTPFRSNRRELFCKKAVPKNFAKFTGKNLCRSLCFNIKVAGLVLESLFNKIAGLKAKKRLQHQACNFIKKETVAQVFSCEFCEISRNTFFYRTPPDECLWILNDLPKSEL